MFNFSQMMLLLSFQIGEFDLITDILLSLFDGLFFHFYNLFFKVFVTLINYLMLI